MPQFSVRAGRRGDGPAAFAIFHDAVHRGAVAFYSPEERAAWAPDTPGPGWEDRLLSGHCRVAEDADGQVIGFMTLGDDGYLDFAYVAADWMGRGVADAIYAEIEEIAAENRVAVLSTEASHLACRFFTRKGWETVARQSVIRSSTALTNFRMQKVLHPLP